MKKTGGGERRTNRRGSKDAGEEGSGTYRVVRGAEGNFDDQREDRAHLDCRQWVIPGSDVFLGGFGPVEGP